MQCQVLQYQTVVLLIFDILLLIKKFDHTHRFYLLGLVVVIIFSIFNELIFYHSMIMKTPQSMLKEPFLSEVYSISYLA